VAIWQRRKVQQPISERVPAEKSLLPWLHKEGYVFLQQTYRWINWAVKYLGKVGVDLNDVPGTAENKLIAGLGMSITKIGADGDRQLIFSANPGSAPPIPPDPVIASSTLYTARIGDPHYCSVKYLMANGQGLGFDMEGWDYLGGGSWQQKAAEYNGDGSVHRKHNYAVKGALYSGSGWSAPLAVGDQFFVPYVHNPDVIGENDSRFWGVYEIVLQGEDTPGDPQDGIPWVPGGRAIIKRADFANTEAGLCGLVVAIAGDPLATNYGKFYHITNTPPFVVNDTPVTLELLNSYTLIEKYEALTGVQLTSEGASYETVAQSVTVASFSGYVEASMPKSFVTLAMPIDSLASGPYKFDVETVSISGASDGSISFLRVRVLDVDNGLVVILTADSAPIVSAAEHPITFTTPLASAYTFTPGHRLLFQYYLLTNSTSAVTLTMRYNSSARGTKITLPFELPVSGAGDGVHDHLSGRDTVNNHYGTDACTTASGIVPVPTKSVMHVTVSGSPLLLGMGTTGLQDGVRIELTFLQSCSLIGQYATPGAGNAAFLLSRMNYPAPDQVDFVSPGGRIGFTYHATGLPESPCFQQTWGPIT
jgi:hypothetical protein